MCVIAAGDQLYRTHFTIRNQLRIHKHTNIQLHTHTPALSHTWLLSTNWTSKTFRCFSAVRLLRLCLPKPVLVCQLCFTSRRPVCSIHRCKTAIKTGWSSDPNYPSTHRSVRWWSHWCTHWWTNLTPASRAIPEAHARCRVFALPVNTRDCIVYTPHSVFKVRLHKPGTSCCGTTSLWHHVSHTAMCWVVSSSEDALRLQPWTWLRLLMDGCKSRVNKSIIFPRLLIKWD